MMFCPKCGTQVNESAQFCQKCGTAVAAGASATVPRSTEEAYKSLPWYRKNGPASLLVLIGLVPFIGTITLLIVCVILISGPIYFPKAGKNGELKKWSIANTVVAWLILIVQLAVIVLVVTQTNASPTDSVTTAMQGAADALVKARKDGNEASAIGSLRAINIAQATFAASCGNGFYSPGLVNLGTAEAGSTPFISSDLSAEASVTRSGYTITMGSSGGAAAGAPASCNGVPAGAVVPGYWATAIPISADAGTRIFGTNTTGTIFVLTPADVRALTDSSENIGTPLR